MLVLSLLSGCVDFNHCEWEEVPFEDTAWAGASPEEWVDPYLGSWAVEPVWLWSLRPPLGVGEGFQIDLTQSDQPVVVRQILERGNCDPSPTLEISVMGSVQSLDGVIQAVQGNELYPWRVSVTEDGQAGLNLRSETLDGTLAWSERFDGDPEEGHNWRFHLRATDQGGELALDHAVRNDEVNKASSVWGQGRWVW